MVRVRKRSIGSTSRPGGGSAGWRSSDSRATLTTPHSPTIPRTARRRHRCCAGCIVRASLAPGAERYICTTLMSTATPNAFELLERVLDQTAAAIAGVRPDQAALPTPCPSFDVRHLVNHTVYDVQTFASMVKGGER